MTFVVAMVASRFARYQGATLSVRVAAFTLKARDFFALTRYWIPFMAGAVGRFFVDLP